MKKYILAITLFCIFPLFLKSQSFEIGPRVGLNMVPLTNDDLNGQQFKMDWNAGLFSSFKIKDWLWIRPEVNYSGRQKYYSEMRKSNLLGALDSIASGFGSFTDFLPDSLNLDIDSLMNLAKGFVNDTVYHKSRIHSALSYIEIPVMFDFRYKSFSLGVGPYLGILVNSYTSTELTEDIPLLTSFPGVIDAAQEAMNSSFQGITLFSVKNLISMQYPGYYSPNVTESSSMSNYNILDYGLVVSLSCRVETYFEISLRYTYGFTKLRRDIPLENDNLQSLQFNLAYNLRRVFSKPPKY